MRPRLPRPLVLVLTLGTLAAPATAASFTATTGDVGPVVPNEDVAKTEVTVVIHCALFPENETAPPRQVTLGLEEAPPWATVTVSPTTIVADRDGCVDGVWTGHSSVYVSTTPKSVAFTPTAYIVRATLLPTTSGNFTTAWTTYANGTIVAGPLSVIDAVASATIATVAPGEDATFDITVENRGNHPTNVFFELVSAPPTWGVARPPPLALAVGVLDANGSTATSTFTVTGPMGEPYANAVEQFVLEVRSRTVEYANVTYDGDTASLAFLVTVRGITIPGVGAGALVVAAAALALVRRH